MRQRHIWLPPSQQPIYREYLYHYANGCEPYTDCTSWGFGKHACPGRFYAIKLAKMVYMVLLEKYEFKWDGKPREEHPASFEVQGQFLPNMEAKICIRRREHYAP
jgi:cytochrome P450